MNDKNFSEWWRFHRDVTESWIIFGWSNNPDHLIPSSEQSTFLLSFSWEFHRILYQQIVQWCLVRNMTIFLISIVYMSWISLDLTVILWGIKDAHNFPLLFLSLHCSCSPSCFISSSWTRYNSEISHHIVEAKQEFVNVASSIRRQASFSWILIRFSNKGSD